MTPIRLIAIIAAAILSNQHVFEMTFEWVEI